MCMCMGVWVCVEEGDRRQQLNVVREWMENGWMGRRQKNEQKRRIGIQKRYILAAIGGDHGLDEWLTSQLD